MKTPNTKTTIIEPAKGWHNLKLSELWSYRELLWVMMLRDIKVRYKQTVLGVAWAIIQPLMTMIIFSLIFGRLANIPSDGIPYPVFVFAGLLSWTFFSSAITSCSNSLVGAAGMINKVYFPRLIIPIASIGVSAVDFFIATGVFLLLMLVYSVPFNWQILWVPGFLLGLFVTALGLGLWLAAITVLYRDFRYIVPFMLQLWMFVTPVIYPLSFIPDEWRWLIYANPIIGWVNGMRAAFLGLPIDWVACGISTVFAALLLFIGFAYFSKVDKHFADVV